MLDHKVLGAQIHQFNNIQTNAIPRSTFDRSFPILTTHGTDYLIPLVNDEILPGDHIRMRMTTFTRLNPTVKPIMDNLYRENHAFFVPYRLLWENFEKFQGAQINPGDTTAYTLPVYDTSKAPLSSTGFAVQSLQDYMEIPPLVSADANTKIVSLYERAYYLVCNTWYRDENLDDSLDVPLGDGPDDPSKFFLQKRRKRKDYRTSALPWPQKGDAVTISIGGNATVKWDGVNNLNLQGPDGVNRGLFITTGSVDVQAQGTNPAATQVLHPSATQPTGYVADLTTAEGITVNAFRQLVTMQQMLELDARGGTRYTENLYSRWGVIAPDSRLQRPELIGQSVSPITVYAVPQTAPTTDESPQGNLAAYSTGIHNDYFEYTAQEHGILLVLTNVRADLRYSQYLPRKRTRQLRTDMYEPIFANVGEQPVRQDEVKWTGVVANDSEPFGYQEPWSVYRYKDASITGLMRPAVPDTLAVWNLSQNLGGTPVLNSSFIQEAVPMDRVLSVTDEPAFLVEGHCNYIHTRAMPIRSNPGLTRI